MPDLVHATAVAVGLDADGPLAGALIFGASGSGKSSLALLLIETCPWRRTRLVSDDGTLLRVEGGRLKAEAPQPIAGLLEVRGFGPTPVRTLGAVAVTAGFDLVSDGPRLASPALRPFVGTNLACWPLVCRDVALAATRLRVILRAIVARNSGAGGDGGPPDEGS